MPIYTMRTTRGREKTAIKSLRAEIKNSDYEIKAILYPQDLKGYLFVEGGKPDIDRLVRNVRHVKGIIDEEVEIEDIEKFMSDEPQEIKLEANDRVEVIAGPYKGEPAEIERIDEANNKATIKLLEAAVPIPVTIDIEQLRKRSKEE